MIKLCITGAYGLVGKNFLSMLPRFINEPCDVTKIKCDEIPDDLEPQDFIVHAAGYGQPLKFTKDKIKTIQINTETTIKLFHKLKPGGSFLFVSTSEVYSGAEYACSEEAIGITTPAHPRACYIEGKRCGEAICHSFKDSGYNVKIARLALAYGPGTKKKDTRVLNQFIEQAISGNITLRDQGDAVRTYCYVDDAVSLLWKILLYGRDTVYNVGGFSTLTILELAEEIGKILNASVTLPDSDTGLHDAPRGVILDMNKTLKEFDQGFIPIHQGLIKTIEYQKHLYGF